LKRQLATAVVSHHFHQGDIQILTLQNTGFDVDSR